MTICLARRRHGGHPLGPVPGHIPPFPGWFPGGSSSGLSCASTSMLMLTSLSNVALSLNRPDLLLRTM